MAYLHKIDFEIIEKQTLKKKCNILEDLSRSFEDPKGSSFLEGKY
jgi:hypothetical protein